MVNNKMQQMKIKQKIEKCSNCRCKHLTKDNQHGELICQNCGLVLDEDLIDYSPEWRAYDAEQQNQRARTGSPMNEMIYDKGLSTNIDWKNKDYSGKSIPSKNRSQLRRIRRWHQRTRMKRGSEYSLHLALQHISRISSTLSLPQAVRENAAAIYRKTARNNLVRGRSIKGITAATVYAGCRRCNVPRSLDEVSRASGINKKEIGRNYRFLSKELTLKLLPVKPHDYLNRFSNKLNLQYDTNQKARQLLNNILEDKNTCGINPVSIAAAAIYVASVLCDDKKTQKEIAETAGVTEVTIRKHYKKLIDNLNINFAF